MIPLQIHYGGGDSWCAQGSFGVALDEEGSGVGATAEEHRWQNHVLCALTCPFQQWGPRQGRLSPWGWQDSGAPQPCAWWGKNPARCVAGREGSKSQVKALSLQSAGVVLSGQSCPVPPYCAWSHKREGRGAECRGAAFSWCHTLTWYHLPSLLGREAFARATQLFLAKSVFPWYCQEVPG